MSRQRDLFNVNLMWHCNYFLIPNVNIVTGKATAPIYLHKVDFAYLLVYNQSLTTASQSRLFGTVVRALVLYRGDQGLILSKSQEMFQLCLTLLLLSCRKNMFLIQMLDCIILLWGLFLVPTKYVLFEKYPIYCPGLDISFALKAFHHDDSFEEGGGGGCYGQGGHFSAMLYFVTIFMS